MSQASAEVDQYQEDLALTLRNRERLTANTNLLYWYRELYREQFSGFANPERLAILEIGSGVSPLKRLYPSVLTSDVLQLDYLDFVFDCHLIDQFEPIKDASLDAITLTNVLHHLKSPIDFMNRAAAKLKPGGKIIATEPFFSVISSFIYRRIHHEPVDFEISEPVLENISGPLASANIALPWLIFYKRPAWSERLRANYSFDERAARAFSSISYMATGGISRQIPMPGFIYRVFFAIDMALSRIAPRFAASFFTITLTKK